MTSSLQESRVYPNYVWAANRASATDKGIRRSQQRLNLVQQKRKAILLPAMANERTHLRKLYTMTEAYTYDIQFWRHLRNAGLAYPNQFLQDSNRSAEAIFKTAAQGTIDRFQRYSAVVTIVTKSNGDLGKVSCHIPASHRPASQRPPWRISVTTSLSMQYARAFAAMQLIVTIGIWHFGAIEAIGRIPKYFQAC